MNCNKKCGFNACGCLGIVLSIVFGAIIGLLFAFDHIPFIVISTWIAFGLGILSLIILVVGVFLAVIHQTLPLQKCLCQNTKCLLAGIIGTIISALAALSIVLTNEFISVIVLVSIEAFFFAMMILNLIGFINCIVCRMCSARAE